MSDQDDTSPDNQSDLMSSVGLKVKNLKPIQRNGTNGNLRVFKLLNVIEFQYQIFNWIFNFDSLLNWNVFYLFIMKTS